MTAPAERPLCLCHGEPMYWKKRARYRAGGHWTCRVRALEATMRAKARRASGLSAGHSRRPPTVTFCACGCGAVVTTSGARWATGHNKRGVGGFERHQERLRNGLPLCRCGCGQRVAKPDNQWVHGHHRRGAVVKQTAEARERVRGLVPAGPDERCTHVSRLVNDLRDDGRMNGLAGGRCSEPVQFHKELFCPKHRIYTDRKDSRAIALTVRTTVRCGRCGFTAEGVPASEATEVFESHRCAAR